MQTISKHSFIKGHCEVCGQRHTIQDVVFITDDLDMITLSVCKQCSKKLFPKIERKL